MKVNASIIPISFFILGSSSSFGESGDGEKKERSKLNKHDICEQVPENCEEEIFSSKISEFLKKFNSKTSSLSMPKKCAILPD